MNDERDNNDDIDRLLEDYKTRRDNAEKRGIEPLEPPKKRDELIDFSKPNDSETSEKQSKAKKRKPKKTPEEIEAKKAKINERLKKASSVIFSKKVIIAVICVLLAVALFFAVKYAVDYSKTAYLNPYKSEYPDVSFPDGILEEYCEDYAENPDTAGYIKIGDDETQFRITAEQCEELTEGAERLSYVVYLDSTQLEEQFASADACNGTSKEVIYSDLCENYTFQVAGAFYTNTKAEDDNGYIFPYNVTEKMTLESMSRYFDGINSRLLYTVSGAQLTRDDRLLIISCPTDYKEDYRFVIVCKAVDSVGSDATATSNENARKTASEYDSEDNNPYRFASKWYPEIIITDEDGNESTITKSIEDYE